MLGFCLQLKQTNQQTDKQTNKSCFRINFNTESAQAPFATKMMTSYDADDDNGGTRLVLVCELHFCKTMEVVAFALHSGQRGNDSLIDIFLAVFMGWTRIKLTLSIKILSKCQ